MASIGGTSGTRTFNPSLGELVIYAFNLCGVRPTALTQPHMESARMGANLLLGEWSARPGVNLWEVSLVTFPLLPSARVMRVAGSPSNRRHP